MALKQEKTNFKILVYFFGRAIGPTQRPLPNKIQHSQQTDIQVPGGIGTNNPSKWGAVEPRLRQPGHWDRFS